MLELDIYGTLVAASSVLLLGRLMLKRIPLLAAYTIPEPVAGGLLAALLLLAVRSSLGFEVKFDSSLGAPPMCPMPQCSCSFTAATGAPSPAKSSVALPWVCSPWGLLLWW